MSGLLPLSYTLVRTLIGDDGYYKIDRDDDAISGGPPLSSYKKRKSLKGLNLLLDLEIATIRIYNSKKKYLGFIHWNNWNEGDERVSDYSTYFDEHWGKFGATATSGFESIGDLCRDWHEKWREL